MNYSLRTHIECSDSLTYEHYKVKEREIIDIRKYIRRHNQTVDETYIQMEICFTKQVLTYD